MPAARDTARAVAVIAVIAAALYLLYRLREVVGLVAVSVFVAVALAPVVAAVGRLRVPRALAILIVYAGILVGMFGVGLVVVPPVAGGVDKLTRAAPGYITEIERSPLLGRYDRRYRVTATLRSQASRLPTVLNRAAGGLESVTVGVFRRLFELITVLTLAFFLLIDGPRIADFGFRTLGPERERRARALANDAARAVGGYVVGAIAIAVLAGVVSFAMMTALGLPFAIPLAVLMAFLALIPLVGSAIGALPIAAVAALHSFPTALIVWVVFFIVYQQVESRVLGPWVYRRTVAVHPLLAIVAVLAGASLQGILGALLAIPVAAIVQLLIREWWGMRSSAAPSPAVAAGEGAR
jgi:predicted PurR-regulated permease PerM